MKRRKMSERKIIYIKGSWKYFMTLKAQRINGGKLTQTQKGV